MTINITDKELNLILDALNIVGATDPSGKYDDLYDALVERSEQ